MTKANKKSLGGKSSKKVSVSLEKLLETFLLEQKCKGNSPKTVIYYRIGVGRFIQYARDNFGSADLEFVSLENVKSYIMHLKGCKKWEDNDNIRQFDETISSKTVQTYVRAVKSFVSWLETEEMIEEGTASKIKLPKATRKVVEILSESEIEEILHWLKNKKTNKFRDLLIFSCFLETGARLNEIVNLKLMDIRVDNGLLKVLGKGNRERVISFGVNLQKLFYKYINLERPAPASKKVDSLFLKEDGNPITETTVKQLFRRIKEATGIEKLHPHLLRHTMITMSLARDSNIFALKQKTGHSSFGIMENYLHMAQGFTNMQNNGISLLDSLNYK